jgi:hypothetical protein
VARSNWKEMRSVGIRRTRTTKPVEELGRLGQVSTNHRYNFVESDFAGGPVQLYGAYDDSTILLLAHLLGAVATSGSGPYTHLVTLASPLPTGLTLEQINGTGNGILTGMAEVFEGCKFSGGKLSISAGGLFVIDGEVIAQTSAGLVAAGTPTYTTGGERIRHNHAAALTIGGTATAYNSLSISIERGLSRNHEMGSLFTSEPVETQLEITGELRCKWQTAVHDTRYLAGTQVDLVLPFTGSGSNAMTLTAHNILVEDVSREVSSKGAVEQVIKFRPYADATDQGLSLSFVNANEASDDN